MNSTDHPIWCEEKASAIRERLQSRSLILIGLMGAGKSTIGKKVAILLGLPFFDADTEIETASHMTIGDLFDTYGEVEFRDLERRVIQRILKMGPMVLATGGGAYMNPQTRLSITKAGIALWLKADIDLLMTRVLRRQSRPLLKNDNPRKIMERLMEERYPIYAQADICVTTRDEKKEIIALEVLNAMAQHLNIFAPVSTRIACP